ncbi:MAG: hypothetical protein K6T63_07030 [Alicyclobacillus herbarius]|uniref:hypothetical protein n=1 Tax=Alicyclobacillus herbarius TaxID=122960 RepID=UPI002355E318|nr:hypothetical protein [Alicyclobacillus herbarius]MCL6632375.1 hypothetical protein [Alicyclobacillus herbarius]
MSTTEKQLQSNTEASTKALEAEAPTALDENSTFAETEAEETRRLKLEDLVRRYFQNKEIAKERNEENKLLFEELEQLFQESGEEEIVIPLPSGENAVLSPRFREREVLDKEGLADEMQVSKDELKTPYDFSVFTAQGKMTPAMITRHTTIEREVKLRISKRKATTRRRRRRSK